MQKIIYYVASSLDGFIAGKNDDISQFILESKGVEKYKAELLEFKTVLMGRRTYEFGFKYGLKAEQPAYPNMEHYIFSDSMEIENSSFSSCCVGGKFAGWLLDNELIDKVKSNNFKGWNQTLWQLI